MINIIILCLLVVIFVLEIMTSVRYKKEIEMLKNKSECNRTEINLLKYDLNRIATKLQQELKKY